ncbi:hypothetical protein DFH06DRAFT_1318729 [Mycena polygramma]|nr:hypothetical protein DFH06DRAFT_1314367 [Mycena polygramma]KAJ7983279.1 hypothetical protein DFH06DRAFT_1318729 [Mycena polygramma]
MPRPPPPYQAHDDLQDVALDSLISNLSDLQVSALSQPSPRVSRPLVHPPPPPPRTPSPPPSGTRLYVYNSPTRSGHTTEWSEAAHHTQGSPQSRVKGIGKAHKKPRRHNKAYVVFYGLIPGVYDDWYGADGAEVQVSGVPGSVSQGYRSREEGEAAYTYAIAHNWTGVRRRRNSPNPTPPTQISTLPVPFAPLDPTPNPLHGAANAPSKLWYNVYAGITPGIYLSYLECSLNIAGLSCAAHDSAPSLSEARRRWNVAQREGRVKFLTHPYTS